MADLKPPLDGYSIWLMSSADLNGGIQELIDEFGSCLDICRFPAHATLIGLLDKGPSDKECLMSGMQALAH